MFTSSHGDSTLTPGHVPFGRLIATIALTLAGVTPAVAEFVDPFELQLEPTREIEVTLEVLGVPEPPAGIPPAQINGPWLSADAAEEELGAGWYLGRERVWMRIPLDLELPAGTTLSFAVPGEPLSFYADEARIGAQELEWAFAFPLIESSFLRGAEYLYVGIRRPYDLIDSDGVLVGPRASHRSAVERYAAWRARQGPPSALLWTSFEGDLTDAAQWGPIDATTIDELDGSRIAARFSPPPDVRGAALAVLTGYGTRGMEVRVNGDRYYSDGVFGRYRAPEAAVGTDFYGTVVTLPRSYDANRITVIRDMTNSIVLRTQAAGWDEGLGIVLGDGSLLLRSITYFDSTVRTYVAGPATVLVLAVLLFLATLLSRGRGRASILLLSGLLLAVAVAWLGDQLVVVLDALPLLRALPYGATAYVFVAAMYGLPLLLLYFHRATTSAEPARWQRTAGRVLISLVAAMWLIDLAWKLLAVDVIDWNTTMTPLFRVVFLGFAYVASLVLLVLHARRAGERAINRLLILSGVGAILFGLFQVLATVAPWPSLTPLQYSTWASILLPVGLLPLLGISLVVYRRAQREVESANIVFRRFVPDEFLSFLGVRQLSDIRPGQQIETHLTVMFCDIRGFTAMAEGMRPAEAMGFVNSYLEFVGPIIRSHGGFVDKYLGDGLMALFPGGGRDACAAALEITDGISKFDEDRSPTVGIGLHTGPAMLGTIGEHDRLDTTVISDAVNTASRLQALSGAYGCAILASEETVGEDDGNRVYYSRLVDRVRLKGKDHVIQVREIRDPGDAEVRASLDATYRDALEALAERDLDRADALLRRCLEGDGEDPAYRMLHERVQLFRSSGFPENWDGVVTRTRK